MKNFLILTNADMSVQAGNVVLINRRAEEFYRKYNVRTTCIVMRKLERPITHKTTGIDYKIESSKVEIEKFIKSNKPSSIVFYGSRTYKFISEIKRVLKTHNISSEILIDLQGALEELTDFSIGIEFLKNNLKLFVKRKSLSNALNSADGAFVVSDEMKKYCISFLDENIINKFKFYKVRCGINEIFKTQEKISWRNEVRKKWGIKEDTTVMVFSGYRMPWQKVNETIEIFQEYDKKTDNLLFVFYCNTDENFEALLRDKFPKKNYVVEFLSFENYFKHLVACDVGFLIRDYNTTNLVAFPNKFSDYMNAGLMIATNSAVPETYNILMESGIDFIDINNTIDKSYELARNRQKNLKTFYKKSELVCENELLYSKQISNIIS
ncbi:hypothetical protein NM897_02155 [Planococcus maritimus]|uniref:hypothetical protein n=1 Tax=Planococcus maritimus TaxID=192421 RepID=UPI003139CEF4